MLSKTLINKALADDPEGNLSEWAAEFRVDIGAFLSDADIDACVDSDRPLELPPRRDVIYHAFVDPSGGRHDAFCLSIGHRDGDRTVIDVLRGRYPPFDPKLATVEYAALLKEYCIREVDRRQLRRRLGRNCLRRRRHQIRLLRTTERAALH